MNLKLVDVEREAVRLPEKDREAQGIFLIVRFEYVSALPITI